MGQISVEIMRLPGSLLGGNQHPAVVERLRRAIFPWRVTPPQPIAIDEDYAAQHAPVIDSRLAMALREERLQPLHLLIGQPEKVAHHHPRQFGSLNHAGRAALSRLMGPDPSLAEDTKLTTPLRRECRYPPFSKRRGKSKRPVERHNEEMRRWMGQCH